MRVLSLAAAILTLTTAVAPAAQTSGAMALALTGLVAERDVALRANERYVVAALFAGNERVFYPAGRHIVVSASHVVCRISDVQITARSCLLTFGRRTVSLTGPAANALYSTLAANDVAGDGAAGTIFEAVHGLVCTLTPSVIKQNGGGGAACVYTVGP